MKIMHTLRELSDRIIAHLNCTSNTYIPTKTIIKNSKLNHKLITIVTMLSVQNIY